MVPPLSLVVDNLGIYFDERQPSRLENILQNHQFNTEELFQAAQIREKLVAQNISKYNVGDTKFSLPETAHDKRVLLVIGQVEDDASIRFGSPRIKKNSDLLRLVRERNPDAFVIYKPHPDVVSGNRVGKIERELTDKWADWTAEFANISDCLNASDEVHTMTSLTGFEALLRGKMVCCYGSPFYAHWGLTRDEYAMPRRSRRLSLDELVCGTLLHYPLYLNPNFGEHTNALTVIEMVQRQKNLPVSLKRSVVAKQFEKLRQLLRLLKSP